MNEKQTQENCLSASESEGLFLTQIHYWDSSSQPITFRLFQEKVRLH